VLGQLAQAGVFVIGQADGECAHFEFNVLLALVRIFPF
jgi:hypothetical protein